MMLLEAMINHASASYSEEESISNGDIHENSCHANPPAQKKPPHEAKYPLLATWKGPLNVKMPAAQIQHNSVITETTRRSLNSILSAERENNKRIRMVMMPHARPHAPSGEERCSMDARISTMPQTTSKLRAPVA